MRRLFLLWAVFMAAMAAYADEVTFKADAPDAVVSGEQFRLTYTVNTHDVKDFRAPSMEGFNVLMGPSSSRQSSTNIINGKITSTQSITYTYILEAGKEGDYRIAGANITAKGKNVTSNALTIKVLPPDKTPANSRGGGTSSSGSSSISADDLFILATVSKTSVYEQEAFLLTYKIYTVLNLTNFGALKSPDFKGFHSQEVELPSTKSFQLEHYKGRNYKTLVWTQHVLFPQQAGKLEIPACEFEATIAKAIQSVDPFDAFFNGGTNYVEMKKKIASPKITIDVKPLPGNKPASFSGAVGDFSISSSINATELKTNDALTVKLVISGVGNMKLIGTPEVDFPKDFEIYDPKVDNKQKLTSNGLSGNKVIEYLAIPRHAGTFTIPPVEFSYFDLKSNAYKTLTTEAYTVNVAKGEGSAEQVVADFTNKEDLKVIGKDIRFIKTGDVAFAPKGRFFAGSLAYYLWYLVPLCLFIAFAVIYRKQVKENANMAKVRTKKANKVAAKRMKQAARLLAANQKGEFYDEVLKALWGYISDKLNIPVSQLSKGNIAHELSQHGVDEELTKEFIDTLDQCEFARYAPGDESAAMDNVYTLAVNVISKMENTIKH